ncbi:MAG: tetratricopeptide repeat protein [Deltaproteobacteria bacterium]|jgi:Tfp pilus assembly protein PilF|nr:tetratricopeptide repeat protein [Deltaproteobacteria bacterium]MBW2542696.1 tetratricopeptide repeat protein [Deltaproteobacteria bacterium]
MDQVPLRTREIALAGLIAVASLALYAPVLGFEFVIYDDPEYVTENAFVMQGLSATGLVAAVTDTQLPNWHPLTWLSHMLDIELFGLGAAGHHAVNALLHALNAALVFLLLRFATAAVWRSALVAAAFALHPLHIESVAWVSERKDVLSTAFGLGASLAYLGYARRGGALRYGAVTLLFGAALLSKSMLVTLPCVFLLLDHWPLARLSSVDLRRLVCEKLPWFGMSAALCAVTLLRQHAAGTMEWAGDLHWLSRIAAGVHAYAGYCAGLLWPTGLAVHYPHPYLPQWGGTAPALARLALEAAVLSAATWLCFSRSCPPAIRVGWLWFLGTLVPVIGLIQVGNQGMADRYTYIPSIGFFVAIVWAAERIWAQLPEWRGLPQRAAAPLACVCLAALAVASHLHLPTWRDSETLIGGALAANPRNATMWLALGDARRAEGDMAGATEAYEAVLAINPSASTALANMAGILHSAGEHEAAIAHYRAAVPESPRPAQALSNLGGALHANGDHREAIETLNRAIEHDPNFAEAHYNLGNVHFSVGAHAEARSAYSAAIAARPDFALAHLNLGRVKAASGDLHEALEHFQRAVNLDPDHPAAQQSLERALALVEAG